MLNPLDEIADWVDGKVAQAAGGGERKSYGEAESIDIRHGIVTLKRVRNAARLMAVQAGFAEALRAEAATLQALAKKMTEKAAPWIAATAIKGMGKAIPGIKSFVRGVINSYKVEEEAEAEKRIRARCAKIRTAMQAAPLPRTHAPGEQGTYFRTISSRKRS